MLRTYVLELYSSESGGYLIAHRVLNIVVDRSLNEDILRL